MDERGVDTRKQNRPNLSCCPERRDMYSSSAPSRARPRSITRRAHFHSHDAYNRLSVRPVLEKLDSGKFFDRPTYLAHRKLTLPVRAARTPTADADKPQDINSIYNVLELLQGRARSTEALVMVKLDIARNRILTAGLVFSMASTCFTLGTLVSGVFGETTFHSSSSVRYTRFFHQHPPMKPGDVTKMSHDDHRPLHFCCFVLLLMVAVVLVALVCWWWCWCCSHDSSCRCRKGAKERKRTP